MSRQLTDRGLPFYDDDTDPPLGGAQQQDLAETAGEVLLFRKRSSRATRGTATQEGLVHVGTDAKVVSFADGSEWIELQLLPPQTKTSSFPLDLSMLGRVVETHSSSALVVTVPTNADVAFPVGAIVQIDRLGEGTVAIAAAGDVVIRSAGGRRKISEQYAAVSLRQRAIDEWVLVGALSS